MSGFLDAWHLLILHLALQTGFILRALMRPNRAPSARLAWVMVIILAPVVGMLAYLLFGETSIGRARVTRVRAAQDRLPAPETEGGSDVPPHLEHIFSIGRSISGFLAVAGNHGHLLADSDAAIEAMVADIDAAEDHVHLSFYIWLPDGNGLKVAQALVRAAGRGVTCRAMADDLGSRQLVRSEHWRAMADAGVRLTTTLPIGNPLIRLLSGRIDLRNHRKILVVDNRVTYCGSQNCADPAFLPKARFAPWVDLMVRFTGPVVRQNQHLFAVDWMAENDEDLSPLLTAPLPAPHGGFLAQAIGTGPTVRASSMPEIFTSLMFQARRELVVTTPYFVPDEPILSALCAAARRDVQTVMVLPAVNDSRLVAAASRSYYGDLLQAGVQIFEYKGGLLHTKSITVDGELTLIGSANMDRRSFELNYENNILLADHELTGAVRARQADYVESSREVTAAEVAAWSPQRKLWHNALAMFGPIL